MLPEFTFNNIRLTKHRKNLDVHVGMMESKPAAPS
jgi:hypothetical protein